MVDLRTLLAAVLGVVLGVVCLVAPGVVVRAHSVGRGPHDRSGEYGTDGSPSSRVRLLVRLVGVACVIAGAYFAATALG
jgi:hypothetical protein